MRGKLTFSSQRPAVSRVLNRVDTGTRQAAAATLLMVASLYSYGQENGESIGQATDTTDNYSFLAAQIDSGEADVVLNQVDTLITQIEAVHHRYHPDLLTPLTLRGDAHMAMDEPEKAIEAYSRARHVARVSNGLFDSSQINVIYREADAFRALGDLATTAKREEYAYEVARRAHDEYAPALLAPLDRLANFYVETDNPLAARTLLNRAYLIHQANDTHFKPEVVPVLRGIANTHRLERFPAVYVDNSDVNQLEGPQTGLINGDLDNSYLTINSFPHGERALQSVVEVQRQLAGRNSEQELDAILELADWHLLFGRNSSATTLYEHVYLKMDESGRDAQAFFAKPHLLHFPRPMFPKSPPVSVRGDLVQGNVALEFAVSSTGKVRNLQTVANEGPRNMIFRTRRSIREATFRPRLEAGLPVRAEAQPFKFEFPYYTRTDRPAPNAEQADNVPAATNPEDVSEAAEEPSEEAL